MKKTLLIILLCSLSQFLLAQSGQQWLEKKVSISVQEKPLEEVLKGLERDLKGMVFAYLPGSFDVQRKVSVKMDSVPLVDILNRLFAGQQMECAEMRGKVFLKKKKGSAPGKASEAGKGNGKRRKRTASGRGDGASAGQGTAKDPKRKPEAPARKVADSSVKAELSNTDEAPAWLSTLSVVRAQSSEVADGVETDTTLILPESSMPQAKADSAEQMAFEPPEVPELLRLDWQQTPRYQLRSFKLPDLPPLALTVVEAKEKKSFWAWFKMPAFLTRNPDKPARVKMAGIPVNNSTDPEKKGFRFYLGVGVGITPLGSGNGVKIGGRIVWQKKPSLGLGISGYGLIGPAINEPGETQKYRVVGGYGGFHMEYSIKPESPIHLTFPILIGVGGLTYVDALTGNPDLSQGTDITQTILVLEPGAMVEMNVFSFMKIGLDVTYRYSSNSELNFAGGDQILGPKDLNGISAGITIKVGRF